MNHVNGPLYDRHGQLVYDGSRRPTGRRRPIQGATYYHNGKGYSREELTAHRRNNTARQTETMWVDHQGVPVEPVVLADSDGGDYGVFQYEDGGIVYEDEMEKFGIHEVFVQPTTRRRSRLGDRSSRSLKTTHTRSKTHRNNPFSRKRDIPESSSRKENRRITDPENVLDAVLDTYTLINNKSSRVHDVHPRKVSIDGDVTWIDPDKFTLYDTGTRTDRVETPCEVVNIVMSGAWCEDASNQINEMVYSDGDIYVSYPGRVGDPASELYKLGTYPSLRKNKHIMCVAEATEYIEKIYADNIKSEKEDVVEMRKNKKQIRAASKFFHASIQDILEELKDPRCWQQLAVRLNGEMADVPIVVNTYLSTMTSDQSSLEKIQDDVITSAIEFYRMIKASDLDTSRGIDFNKVFHNIFKMQMRAIILKELNRQVQVLAEDDDAECQMFHDDLKSRCYVALQETVIQEYQDKGAVPLINEIIGYGRKTDMKPEWDYLISVLRPDGIGDFKTAFDSAAYDPEYLDWFDTGYRDPSNAANFEEPIVHDYTESVDPDDPILNGAIEKFCGNLKTDEITAAMAKDPNKGGKTLNDFLQGIDKPGDIQNKDDLEKFIQCVVNENNHELTKRLTKVEKQGADLEKKLLTYISAAHKRTVVLEEQIATLMEIIQKSEYQTLSEPAEDGQPMENEIGVETIDVDQDEVFKGYDEIPIMADDGGENKDELKKWDLPKNGKYIGYEHRPESKINNVVTAHITGTVSIDDEDDTCKLAVDADIGYTPNVVKNILYTDNDYQQIDIEPDITVINTTEIEVIPVPVNSILNDEVLKSNEKRYVEKAEQDIINGCLTHLTQKDCFPQVDDDNGFNVVKKAIEELDTEGHFKSRFKLLESIKELKDSIVTDTDVILRLSKSHPCGGQSVELPIKTITEEMASKHEASDSVDIDTVVEIFETSSIQLIKDHVSYIRFEKTDITVEFDDMFNMNFFSEITLTNEELDKNCSCLYNEIMRASEELRAITLHFKEKYIGPTKYQVFTGKGNCVRLVPIV
ncbi:MAG: hypothetical protein GY804_09490 [Alphaproteobacteria bacterium]|nr:hypothetical protein [Alphaproteobacteria bacterium]